MTNTNTQQQNTEEPVRFTPLLFFKMGAHVWRQFDDQYYAGFAAQIAYFFFMSSIPILIVLTQVLGLFDVSMDFIKVWLEMHLSTQMSDFLSGLFNASSAAVTNVLMIILAIWGASSLEFSLSRLSTYTLTGGTYRFDWFRERIKAIPYALTSLILVAFTVLFYVYGEMISLRIFKSQLVADVISAIRTPILALFFFVAVLLNYYIIPRIKVPMKAVLPGAVLATIGILIVTWFYSLYISRAVNYNLIYGTFSNIVAMLLWFYCISWVVCIGMMFNKSWDIYMKKGRLKKEKLKQYIHEQYPVKGEEMWNKLFYAESDIYDKSLDTLAVKFSRKFVPGYEEKRQKEIEEFHREEVIRARVEKEMEKEFGERNDAE